MPYIQATIDVDTSRPNLRTTELVDSRVGCWLTAELQEIEAKLKRLYPGYSVKTEVKMISEIRQP